MRQNTKSTGRLSGFDIDESSGVSVAFQVPAAHGDTSLPLPVYPASALQSVRATLPVLLPVPELEGQSVQAASLFADTLYVPAAQADTLLPLPLNPASARQSDSALLPVLVPVPVLVGHGVQAAALFASAL